MLCSTSDAASQAAHGSTAQFRPMSGAAKTAAPTPRRPTSSGRQPATARQTGSGQHAHKPALPSIDAAKISVVVPDAAVLKSQTGNFRIFLEKLSLRRKHVECSRACQRYLTVCFAELAKRCKKHGLVPLERLQELLAPHRTSQHPTHTSEKVVRELAEVAKGYCRPGEECVDVEELLSCALRVKSGLLSQYKWLLFKVIILLVCVFLPSAVCCAAAGWSFLDAMYFAILTISLVGVPDSMVETTSLKIFAVLYIPLCVGVMSLIVVSWLSTFFVEIEREVRRLFGPDRHRKPHRQDIGDYQKVPSGRLPLEDLLASPAVRRPEMPVSWARKDAAEEPKPARYHRGMLVGLAACFLCLAVAIAEVIYGFTKGEGFSKVHTADDFLDALLWSTATISSIGFMGALPGAENVRDARVLTLCVVLVAVPTWCLLLRHLGLWLTKSSVRRIQADSCSWPLSPEILADLDVDGTGINKMEFLCAMLLAVDKISPDELWKILAQFEYLDVNRTGLLTRAELVLLRKGQLHHAPVRPTPRKKAEEVQQLLPATAQRSAEGSSKDQSRRVHREERGLESTAEHQAILETSTAVKDTPTEGNGAFNDASGSNHTLLERVFQQGINVQRQLDQKGTELEAALRSQRDAEGEVRNALAEQFSLQGKVEVLQAKIAELQTSMEKERQQWEQATRSKCEELRSQLAESEKQCRNWEKKIFELESREHAIEAQHQRETAGLRQVERQWRQLLRKCDRQDQQRKDIEHKCRQTEQLCQAIRQRAERAEMLQVHQEDRALRAEAQAHIAQEKAEHCLQRLQEIEEQWQAHACSLIRDFQKRYTTQDLELRELEMDVAIKSALVELQAYAYQQAGGALAEEPSVTRVLQF